MLLVIKQTKDKIFSIEGAYQSRVIAFQEFNDLHKTLIEMKNNTITTRADMIADPSKWFLIEVPMIASIDEEKL